MINLNIKQVPGSIAIIELWSMELWDGADMYYHQFYMTSKKAADEFMKSLGKDRHFYRCHKVVMKVADSGEQMKKYKSDMAVAAKQRELAQS